MVRLRAALVALFALGALAGCDDEPEPQIGDPTPSVTPSPTEPSPATTSPLPSDPEATIRAWVEAWNDAYTTGDTSVLRAFEIDDCQGCDEVVGPLEQAFSGGGSFQGGEWSVVSVEVVQQSASEAQVALAVDVAEGSAIPSGGASPTPFPASKHLLNFRLANHDDHWRVSDIEVLS